MRTRIVRQPISSNEVGKCVPMREVRKSREYADWVCSSFGGGNSGESQIVRTEPRLSDFYRVKGTLDKWRSEVKREDIVKKPLFKN